MPGYATHVCGKKSNMHDEIMGNIYGEYFWNLTDLVLVMCKRREACRGASQPVHPAPPIVAFQFRFCLLLLSRHGW